MNDLPVLRLTQLLTSEEIKTVHGVHKTLEVGFCPVGVCMSDESRGFHLCLASEGNYSEERYTPRAYYTVSVWKETVKRLAEIPEFSDALEVEWYPVAATFRSVRYLNDNGRSIFRNFVRLPQKLPTGRI